ncbi:MAG: hypothetical protein EZS28_018609, partial [Streblomastix strix]
MLQGLGRFRPDIPFATRGSSPKWRQLLTPPASLELIPITSPTPGCSGETGPAN